MHDLSSANLSNDRKYIPKPEALEMYKKTNQPFKYELVDEKANELLVSFYTTGKFIDFCRGPHIPSTRKINAFKIMSVALRKPSGATTANSARNSISSACRKKPAQA